MIKTPLYRRLQSNLWNEETLNKIDVDIEEAVDPVAEAEKQASQLIANTTRYRRWDTVLIGVVVILLLALIIFGGKWAYPKFFPGDGEIMVTPPIEVVDKGEETPTPVLTNHPTVVAPTEAIAVESRPDLQMTIDKSNIPEELRLGTQFDLIFQISNMGTATAENIFVNYNLPAGVEWISVSEQGYTCNPDLGQEEIITCQVGQIADGQQGQARSRLKVIDDKSNIELLAENYWVTADGIDLIYGTELLHLPVFAPTLSRIALTADPTTLTISGVEQPITQTMVTVEVYDQWDQIYGQEELSVEISTLPDSGSFDLHTKSLVGGTAVFTYTSAGQPNIVPVTATVNTTDPPMSDSLELTIAQVAKTKPDINEQLFFTPEDEIPFLTQILSLWPVEIIGQPQNERIPVVVKMWVTRELIDTENNQLRLSTIPSETAENQIHYAKDKNPDTYPSDPFTAWERNYPRMYQNDRNIPIEIEKDDHEKDYVLIRIMGWIPVNQLETPVE
ncbi:MAG: hypothetical protein KDE48_19070 [Anaerolineales bacterium]|nr:hypothetical protein [Anaerolineales bacterium]